MKLATRLALATPRTTELGLLVLRVWFGAVLAFGHGLAKVTDLSGFTEKVGAMGMPLPGLLGPAAALSELLGGLLMVLGLFTRPASAMVLVTMLVAAFHVHAADPFIKKEFALAYAVAALVTLIAGAGRTSLDAIWVGREPAGPPSKS